MDREPSRKSEADLRIALIRTGFSLAISLAFFNASVTSEALSIRIPKTIYHNYFAFCYLLHQILQRKLDNRWRQVGMQLCCPWKIWLGLAGSASNLHRCWVLSINKQTRRLFLTKHNNSSEHQGIPDYSNDWDLVPHKSVEFSNRKSTSSITINNPNFTFRSA